MTIAPPLADALLGCDGFRVVTADARLGSVEELWLGDDGRPAGFAVRADGGQRGLVLATDVVTVDAERRWVVVDPDARVLELDPPRLVHARERSDRLEAAWLTSGATLSVRRSPERARRRSRPRAEPPLVRSIVLLYTGLAVVVAVVMTLAFVIPYLVT